MLTHNVQSSTVSEPVCRILKLYPTFSKSPPVFPETPELGFLHWAFPVSQGKPLPVHPHFFLIYAIAHMTFKIVFVCVVAERRHYVIPALLTTACCSGLS